MLTRGGRTVTEFEYLFGLLTYIICFLGIITFVIFGITIVFLVGINTFVLVFLINLVFLTGIYDTSSFATMTLGGKVIEVCIGFMYIGWE